MSSTSSPTITQIKQQIFFLTSTQNTQQLQQERSDLTAGRNLCYKAQWIEILDLLTTARANGQDLSLADLEASKQMLHDSLIAFGFTETDWQRICLDAQFAVQFNLLDIHIEQL